MHSSRRWFPDTGNWCEFIFIVLVDNTCIYTYYNRSYSYCLMVTKCKVNKKAVACIWDHLFYVCFCNWPFFTSGFKICTEVPTYSSYILIKLTKHPFVHCNNDGLLLCQGTYVQVYPFQQRIYDLITLNLLMEPVFIAETVGISSDATFAENLPALIKEFKKLRGLKPFKVGPSFFSYGVISINILQCALLNSIAIVSRIPNSRIESKVQNQLILWDCLQYRWLPYDLFSHFILR